MQFDWITFGFQVVNVLILLAILRHFLFRPVAAIIERRRAEVARAMSRADAARTAADRAAESATAEAEETRSRRAAVLTEAEKEAERGKAALIAEAKAEAKRIVEAAEAEAMSRRHTADAARRAEIRDLAVAIVRRLLEAQPADHAIDGYVPRLAEALDRMDGAERSTLLAGDIRFVAPRELDAEEADSAQSVLARYGLDPVPVDVDPGLLAGLELRTTNGVLHNSMARDLDQLARALAADDRRQ